jgi:hypothetical protein
MANEWFYARDGQKFGPVTGKRLKELATIGVVRRNDLIWSPGYAVWRPAKKFRGLLPKMDATSLSPAMSLFWRPGNIEADGDERIKGFLEPDSPATSITPPLPGTATKKAPTRVASAVAAPSSGGHPTPRTIQRRPSLASINEAANGSSSSAVVSRASAIPAPPRPQPQVAAAPQPKGTWAGMSTKEKLALGGGLLTMVVVYGVLLVKALL